MALFYRRVIITNTGAALTDHQVLIESSEFAADVAVYSDKDRTTLLNWWVEETGKVWVKVSLAENANTKIHFYWGDEETNAGPGDGNQVFEFFDGFDGTSLNTGVWAATGNHSVSGGKLRINTGSVYTLATVASQPNTIIEAKARYHDLTGNYAGLMIADVQGTQGGNAGADAVVYLMKNSGNTADITAWAADGTTTSYNIINGTTQWTATTETNYIFGFLVTSDNVHLYKDRLQTNQYSGTWSYPYYIFLGHFTGNNAGTTDGADISFDWVFVRKYTTNTITYKVALGTYDYIGEGNINVLTGRNNPNAEQWVVNEIDKTFIQVESINPGVEQWVVNEINKVFIQVESIKHVRKSTWGGIHPLVGRHGH